MREKAGRTATTKNRRRESMYIHVVGMELVWLLGLDSGAGQLGNHVSNATGSGCAGAGFWGRIHYPNWSSSWSRWFIGSLSRWSRSPLSISSDDRTSRTVGHLVRAVGSLRHPGQKTIRSFLSTLATQHPMVVLVRVGLGTGLICCWADTLVACLRTELPCCR